MILTYNRQKKMIMETRQEFGILELLIRYKAIAWNNRFIYVQKKF